MDKGKVKEELKYNHGLKLEMSHEKPSISSSWSGFKWF